MQIQLVYIYAVAIYKILTGMPASRGSSVTAGLLVMLEMNMYTIDIYDIILTLEK